MSYRGPSGTVFYSEVRIRSKPGNNSVSSVQVLHLTPNAQYRERNGGKYGQTLHRLVSITYLHVVVKSVTTQRFVVKSLLKRILGAYGKI